MYPTGAVRRPILGKCGTGSTQGFCLPCSRPAAVHARNSPKQRKQKARRLLDDANTKRLYPIFSQKWYPESLSRSKKTPCVNAEDANALHAVSPAQVVTACQIVKKLQLPVGAKCLYSALGRIEVGDG